MSIATKLEDVRKALAEFSRKRKFKKANAARAEAAELQASLAKCRGKLEISKKDFARTIKTQSRNIAEGLQIGADTTIQEQTLWDAAIGYMMVKDAIYSLRSIATFDSVSHAYEMLGAAVDLMAERERILPKLPKIGGKRGRNVYGYITSNAALKDKQELLDGFFEELKQTGDIEGCLSRAKSPALRSAERRASGAELSEADRWAAVLDGDTPGQELPELDAAAVDSMMDIHPADG